MLTAGWIRDRWKVEVSQFTGSEPDEDRYDIETHELGEHHEDVEVAKLSAGLRREFALRERARIALGALYGLNRVDDSLRPSYGSNPDGAMVFRQFLAGT